jgi:hypothetical protein
VITALLLAAVSGASLLACMVNGVNLEATLIVFVSSFFLSVLCCHCDEMCRRLLEDIESRKRTVRYVVHIEQPDSSSAIGVSDKIDLYIE